MAAGNRERAIEHIFGHEGGLSLDPNDRGNWTGGAIGKGELKGTKYGISAMSYPNLDIRHLTLRQAAEIYDRDYWRQIRGDLLAAGVDVCTLDAAVNSGPRQAIKWLQKAIGLKADGAWGPITETAARSIQDPVGTVQRMCGLRLGFLRSLASWARYGRGWARRVAELEAFCVGLALTAMNRSDASIAATATAEASAAGRSQRRNQAGAGTSGAAAAGDGVAIATPEPSSGVPLPRPNPERGVPLPFDQVGQLVDVLLVAGLVALVAVAAWFTWRAIAQGQRRTAYRQLATDRSKS